MVRILRDRKGLSLMELVITAAILGFVMSVAPQMFIVTQRYFRLSTTRLDIQREARNILDLMNRSIRQASVASISIDQVSGQPPLSRIQFTKVDGKVLAYYQQNKRFYLKQGNNTKMLSENVRYVTFNFPRSDDMEIVSVSLTLEKATYEGKSKSLHMAVEKVRVMNP